MAHYFLRTSIIARRSTLIASLLPLALCSVAAAQQPMQKPQSGAHHQERAVSVPFPFLDKIIKFPVARLSKGHFNEMGAMRNVLPKGYVENLKADQQVILLSYGFKMGGIVRVFETPAVRGITPEKLAAKINDDGFFRNVSRGDWKLKGVEIEGVYIVCGTQTPEAMTVALQDLQRK